jgi:hypothetical protein
MKKYLSAKQYGNVYVVSNYNGEWAVLDSEDKEIVPFGKYNWIDGFDHELARVKVRNRYTGKSKWGIIDMHGNEVLPPEYDEIWKFLGKGRSDTRVVQDGVSQQFDLNDHSLCGFRRTRKYYDDPGWREEDVYSSYCDAIEGNCYDLDCDYDDPEMIAMYWNTH